MTEMTRRSFLEQLGLVGGSTLVMSAMRSWDLMAAQAVARPQLSGNPRGAKVLVLGAGIAGLTTAYELRKLGYTVSILEARDRVGGVNWSVRRGATHTETGAGGETQVCNFDEGQYLNGGPWRIPHFHTGVLDYCKELGVPLEIFINEAEASYFYFEGAEIGPLAGKRVRMREVKADMIGYTSELMVKATNRQTLDLPLTAQDKEKFVAFLVNEGYLDNADKLYKANPGRGPGDPHNFRALLQSGFGMRIRSVINGNGQAPMFQPIGGMDQFPKGFERKLPDVITFGAEVTAIRQTPTEVKVTYRNRATGAMTEAVADYCISCIPLPVMAGITADIAPATMAAVKSVTYSTSAKMGLQMKRRFWEEDDRIFGGHLYSNLPLGDFAYPSSNYFGEKGVLLGFYGNGRMADLINQSPARRIEHVLTQAGKVHPQLRTEFEAGYCVWWDRIQFSQGAFGSVPVNRQEIIAKADGRIYLGCAAVSGEGSWMEGAIEAAWKQVSALHARVMAA